jgi:hypothetical protein
MLNIAKSFENKNISEQGLTICDMGSIGEGRSRAFYVLR